MKILLRLPAYALAYRNDVIAETLPTERESARVLVIGGVAQNEVGRRRWWHRVLAATAAGGFLVGSTLITAAQAPARTVPIPGFSSIPGALTLSEEHRQIIRQRIEQDKPEVQPVPQAFAPAVGMTAPPELRLAKLPDDLQDLPGITKIHQYVMLDSGLLMIVGDRRLVTAVIGPRRGPSGTTAP